MSDRGRGRPPGTTHDQIRDVALRLFLDQGYAKTSLASIAKAAGISRTTLFAYFPSKRDMMWEDHDRLAAGIDQAVNAGDPRPTVDLIVRAMLVNASYGIAEHATLSTRLRIVEQDDELRAYAALAGLEMTRHIADGVARRVPEADPDMVEFVTRALVAAASRCTEKWAASEHPASDLDAYMLERIAPLIEALRPLLP